MDLDNLYPPTGGENPAATTSSSNGTEIVSTVRKAAATLLPYLLISPPFLPSEVKSAELNLRHSMLSITSEDADQYLVTPHSTSDQDVGTKVISLLDQIRSLAESLHQETDDEVGGAIKLVGKVLFAQPEKGKILASVELGDQHEASKSSLLSLHLKHEVPEQASKESHLREYTTESSWKYDNLLPSGPMGGHWSSSFPISSTFALFSNSNATEVTVDSYDTAGSAGFESARDDSDGAGEEAKPGEYHTSADDFWGGYEDGDEDESKSENPGQARDNVEETEESKSEREKKEEQEYWDRYGGSGDSAPSMTQDDSGYSNDDTYEDSCDSNYREGAFTPNLVKELPKDLSPQVPPRRLSTPPLGNPLPLPSRPTRNGTRSHPRGSDSFDSRVSSGQRSPNRPASPSEADYRVGLAPSSPRKGNSGQRASPDHDDEVQFGNENDNENGSWNGSEDEGTENDHGNRPLPSRDNSSYSIAEVLPPRAPESVAPAQSVYETPNNMTLIELEQYYRNRNQKSRAATKARRGGRYGDERSEDGNQTDASSNNSNMPGLDTFQLPADLNKTNRYVDPIDALVLAQPEVGLGDLSDMIEKRQKEEARRNRSVPRQASMETLKKLAEKQEAEERRPRSSSVTFQEGDPKGAGSGPGFRNFLQMAPSTVFSLSQREEDEQEEEEQFQPSIDRNARPGMPDRARTFEGPSNRTQQAPAMPPPINLRYDPTSPSQLRPQASLPGLDELDSAELDRFVLPGRPRDDESKGSSGLFDKDGNSIDQPGQRSFFQAASTIASTRPLAGSIAPPSHRVGTGLQPLEPLSDGEDDGQDDTYDANLQDQDFTRLRASKDQSTDPNRPSTPDSVRVGFAPDTLRKLGRERLKRRGGEEAMKAEEEELREKEDEAKAKEEEEKNKWAEALEKKREQQRRIAIKRGGATGPIRGGRGGSRGMPIRGGRGRGGGRAQAEQHARLEPFSPELDTSQSLPDLDFDDTRSRDANDGDAAGDVDSTALGPDSSLGGGPSVSPDPRFAGNNADSSTGLAAQLKSDYLKKQRIQAQLAQRERAELQRQRLAQRRRNGNTTEEELDPRSRIGRGGRNARDLPPPSPPHRGGTTPGLDAPEEDPFDQLDDPPQRGSKQRGTGINASSDLNPQARRMGLVQATKARNDSVKEIMKGAWRMMSAITATLPTSGNDERPRLTEADFLRVAREAVRDCIHEGSGDAPLPHHAHNVRNHGNEVSGSDIPPIRGMPRTGRKPQGVRNAEFQAEREYFERERERKDRQMRGYDYEGDRGDQGYGYDGFEEENQGGMGTHQINGYYEDEDDYGGSATEREY